jgi:hypothetical protein
MRRSLLRGLAVAGLIAVLLLAGAGLRASWSPSGWWTLFSLAIGSLGLLLRGPRPRRLLVVLGTASLAVLLAVRSGKTSGGSLRLLTLPSATSSRWLGGLIDEQDVSLLGLRSVLWRWKLPADERAELLPALHDAYLAMRAQEGASPSPVLDTFLRRQRPTSFDTIVIEPGTEAARAGVIFLHGYAGSFTFECWLVAEAARRIGAVTVCPAVGFSGRWGGQGGDRTVRATLAYLHGRGVTRVYLAGISNGAVGAAALAPRLASGLAGLILISGAPAAAASAGVPTLVVQGERDTSASPRSARTYAARTHAEYAGFDGGHFVLLIRRTEVRSTMAGWLRRQEASTPVR